MEFRNFLVSDKRNINNILNDDCLVCIFENLPVMDKLKIELVCKRWRDLRKFSWVSVKTFKICDELFEKMKCDNNGHSLNLIKKRNLIINALRKCGANINYLVVKNNIDLDYTQWSMLFTEISKHCHNVTKLSIIDYVKSDNFCGDAEISLLFKENPKISSIHMKCLYLTGDCLSDLCGNTIKELEFDSCHFQSIFNMYNLCTKIKNVTKFHSTIIYFNFNSMIKSLIKSDCENLLEFKSGSKCKLSKLFYSENVTKFFMKQKQLLKFELPEVEVDKDILQCLPRDSLEKLDIRCNIPYSFYRFKNLKFFNCHVIDLTDEFIKNLTQCIHLESIGLNSLNNSLTTVGENYFVRLENIKSFDFYCSSKKNIDNTLIAVCQCKNLISIKINNEFTCSGLTSICKLPRLNVLKIAHRHFRECDIIDIIDQLNNAKVSREDSHILNVYFTIKIIDYCNFSNFILNHSYPLISVHYIIDDSDDGYGNV